MIKVKLGVLSVALVIILISMAGCAGIDIKLPDMGLEGIDGSGNEQSQNKPEEQDKPKEQEKDPVEARIDQLLEKMSLEDKVGQLFIAAFRYDANGKGLLELDEETRNSIERLKPGGVILFSENIDTIPQTVKLIDDMQGASGLPLFVAVDEEGGRVSRIGSNSKMHATRLPSASVIGSTGNAELAYKAGLILGEELSSLGFNMNFAPVADVFTNPKNKVIGDRSFGNDPQLVADMAAAFAEGMREKNVSAVYKHFPGHGDTTADSHTGAVVVDHDLERLKNIELIPFAKGMESGVDAIMTAHVQVPAISGNSMPATLSPEVLKGLLREELGFEGLIITDALEMGAVSNYWDSGEAALLALEAGADIMLMPSSLEEAVNSILEAVRDGQMPEERINQSVRRILKLKIIRAIIDGKAEKGNPDQVLGSDEHRALVDEIRLKASQK